MSAKGIKYAVRWIAENDESAETDAEVLSGLATVLLVADLFGKDEADVARRVAAFKSRHPETWEARTDG